MSLISSYPLVGSLLFMNFITHIVSHTPWAIIFLITPRLLGVRLYYLQKREECSRIQKRIQGRCSHITDGGKGYGYAIGYWYMMNIQIMPSEYGDTYTVYLIATEASFLTLTRENETLLETEEELFTDEPTTSKKISIWERKGSYSNAWFTKRERDANDTPLGQQESIMDTLIAHQKKHRHTVAYIHGPPGTGKSMMGILIAGKLNGTVCNTLKPWQPGDSLGSLYSEIEPTQKKPLIVVIDEFDTVIAQIHEGIPLHKNIPIATPDKQGWNHFLDEIQRGMYQDVMLILTGNESPERIRELDPSYIRKHRVDCILQMTESLIDA